MQLRAHHLLCALTFRSRGYGDDFVRRFEFLIDQIMQGEPVQIVASADHLCQSKQNCGDCSTTISALRDQRAMEALEKVVTSPATTENWSISEHDLQQLRSAFADGSLRAACEGCGWFDFCSKIAADNFRRARLQLRS